MPLTCLHDIESVIASGNIASGEHVMRFERAFGDYLDNRMVAAVGEISTAITICLSQVGLKPGDEVVMSPLVCLSSSCPVRNMGGEIRWCDVDPSSGNLDPDSLEQAIGSRTKAVLVYHWAGYPAEIEAIRRIARQRNIAVIEDAGEALGATYSGRRIGSGTADFTVFSFYPNRHLSTIEGGAIACARPDSFEEIRRLRRYGIEQRTFRDRDGEINAASDIKVAGWNSYLNNIAGAVGVHQLAGLEERLHAWCDNGRFYDLAFGGVRGVDVLKRPDSATPAYWVYTLLADRADDIMRELRKCGVQCSKVHLRNDHYSAFGDGLNYLPGVERFSRRCFSIPCGPWVSSSERQSIVDIVVKTLKG